MSWNRSEIQDQLQKVFRMVFGDDQIKIFDEMTANDLDDWDSLMHVALIVAIEKEFKVRLNSFEVSNLSNVGEIINLLSSRLIK